MQRRTIRVLLGTQIIFAVVMAMASPVTALLVQDFTHSSTLAGLAQAATIAGGVLAAVPLAELTVRRGRRIGVTSGYLVAGMGAVIVVVGGVVEVFLLVLFGTTLVGAAVAAGLQARFAATDLAESHQRGRAIGIVVWASTFGGVAGPLLAGPSDEIARGIGLPAFTGPFFVIGLGLVLSAGAAYLWLRPDPLLLARSLSGGDAQPVKAGKLRPTLRLLARTPEARRAVIAVAVVHAVMVSGMNMASLHLHHGGESLRVVGAAISVHLAGMFLLSPLFGWLVDRFGARKVLGLGLGLLLLACGILQTTHGNAVTGIMVGLVVLGLGWSAGFVAGSALLTGSVQESARPRAQGVSDLLMQLAAAMAAFPAGAVLDAWGYPWLARLAAVPVVLVAAQLMLSRRRVTADGA
ncbi:MFS family permease [Saccharothrix ecbatanensis]|uniref:MFS family permease n=1 Tax=Saccharothrix ecbatanensis TaxID=1105145 RepID=A0A7W9HJK6_9PSEU|nr:MFS transporter [Saccharothrix ecbatanensis]MBB5803196.1 MFS family permease [Saccharothrix ecbatanensis]